MRTAFAVICLVAAAPLAQAAGNGEHPAIAARRVIAAQGYDYAAAFYRHPAGLDLAITAPARAAGLPDAVVARRVPAPAHSRRLAAR